MIVNSLTRATIEYDCNCWQFKVQEPTGDLTPWQDLVKAALLWSDYEHRLIKRARRGYEVTETPLAYLMQLKKEFCDKLEESIQENLFDIVHEHDPKFRDAKYPFRARFIILRKEHQNQVEFK